MTIMVQMVLSIYVICFHVLTINDQVHEDEIYIDIETVPPEGGGLHGVVNLEARPHVHLLHGGGLVGVRRQRGRPHLQLEELWRVVEDGEEEDGHDVELGPPAPGHLQHRDSYQMCPRNLVVISQSLEKVPIRITFLIGSNVFSIYKASFSPFLLMLVACLFSRLYLRLAVIGWKVTLKFYEPIV